MADPGANFAGKHVDSKGLICKCFRPAMLIRSFTVSKLLNEISGTRNVINHFCKRYGLFMCSFEYCPVLELCVKCAALYRTFIPQSFIGGNNSNGPVVGRVWGVVIDEGGRSTGVLDVIE